MQENLPDVQVKTNKLQEVQENTYKLQEVQENSYKYTYILRIYKSTECDQSTIITSQRSRNKREQQWRICKVNAITTYRLGYAALPSTNLMFDLSACLIDITLTTKKLTIKLTRKK